mmetsp:Transcript_10591/g.28774  ORF Transcript_10591/g.28774 Transcript_10591/m.28774 type:complete len:252 (-) Transcript_10591:363-1118(-)|eukprot:CAMPEP_0185159042 /NCGR_PEP_ID=MMETSP1139-20130426/2801_1 /TAXON_ID=298111 /ORGANISM="Pavlova sp., Strain CCMP459" /LENGTH=251 /DNA_ID=CAMNT_0027724205 /DNA_START=66 /DNA_END=821 /DNA_ORIENTATION=+
MLAVPCLLALAGVGPLQGRLALSLKDQQTLSSPANEATLELRRSFSAGTDKLGALLVKLTPKFDRDGNARDKIEVSASAAYRSADDMILSAEATHRSPDNRFEAKAAVKTRGYTLSLEHDSVDSAAISLVEASKGLLVLGKQCRLNAGVKLVPETTALAKAEVTVTDNLKVTPIVSCRTSDSKVSLVKLEASGIAKGYNIGWKADFIPARHEASLEIKEAVDHGVWIAKATVPTDGAIGTGSIALKREIIW